jgi:hypothetical protein
VTPGDVVMQHEMFEPHPSTPQTEQVCHRPIPLRALYHHKYYAFDLGTWRSLFEFLKSGFTLLSMVISESEARARPLGNGSLYRGDHARLSAPCRDQRRRGPHTIDALRSCADRRQFGGYYAALGQRNIGSMTLFVAPLIRSGMTETPGLGSFIDSKFHDTVAMAPPRKIGSARTNCASPSPCYAERSHLELLGEQLPVGKATGGVRYPITGMRTALA